MEYPIQVKNLKKSYGETQALKGISLEMNPGEILGLLGPNGAGKTTLLSILTTIEKPSSGEALIFGHNVLENSQELKALVGVVPQELLSHGFFSIEEVLEYHSGYYGLKNNSKRIQFLLKRLDLMPHKHKKVRELSGGMKRRFLIAKALVHNPKLLLLDEPTAGVDIELRTTLWEFVRELNAEGVSVVLTTHYLEEAEELCDRIAIIHHGELLKINETQELISSLTDRYVEISFSQVPEEFSKKHLVSIKQNTLVFRVPSRTTLGELISEINCDMNLMTDIKIQEGRLEDAFLNVLDKDKGHEIIRRT